MNFRGHSYIPLRWFVGRLKVIWAGHRVKWALANLAKLPWLCGLGDWGNGDLTIGQFAPHIWQNMANRKIAMWTSQFGKENKSRLKYELG